MKEYLKSGKVRLRALEPEDLELLYSMENDGSLWDVTSGKTPYSRFVLKQYIVGQPQDFFQCGELRLVIETIDSHKAVGLIDLTNHSPTDARAEIGIAIRAEARGRGYASAAISALELYARDILRLRMLYALVYSEKNEACRRLFQKADYREIALLPAWNKRQGVYEDVAVFQKIWDDEVAKV